MNSVGWCGERGVVDKSVGEGGVREEFERMRVIIVVNVHSELHIHGMRYRRGEVWVHVHAFVFFSCSGSPSSADSKPSF